MNPFEEKDHKLVKINRELENLAYLLDGVFRVPILGWRFGFDFIVGLIPGVGDFATALASFYILIAGVRYGIPKITLLRMAINIGIDYLIGLIPILGDVLDLFWKSNERNINLIKTRATAEGAGTVSDYIFVGGIIFTLTALLLGTITMSIWLISFTVRFLIDMIK